MQTSILFCALLCCTGALLADAQLLGRFHRHGRISRDDEELVRRGGSLWAGAPQDGPVARFFTQQIDHFDAAVNDTYQQRYYVNDTFWDPVSGPVFLYIGGEGTQTDRDVLRGHHVEMAVTFKALVLCVEHRYYGASIPTSDLSTANLQWLSSEQALADLAAFHAWAVQNWNMTTNNRWFSFGGSYPGALSAWLRLKYPHVVYGSISSSGPVHAIVNFQDYNNVVTHSLSNPIVGGSGNCATQVDAAFDLVKIMLQGDAHTRSTLDHTFNTCDSLVGAAPYDDETFISNVAGAIMEVVQYNNDLPNRPSVADFCANVTQTPGRPLDGLAQAVAALSNGVCIDTSYKKTLGQLANTTADKTALGVGARQWTYQTCTQFGYYQTCDFGTACVFGAPSMSLAYNLDACQQLFGVGPAQVSAHVDYSNAEYGSDQPQGSRILFVNGEIDPWHALSVLAPIANTTQTAVLIPNTAHCANMEPSRADDPPQLVTARKQIEATIASWLQ